MFCNRLIISVIEKVKSPSGTIKSYLTINTSTSNINSSNIRSRKREDFDEKINYVSTKIQ